MNLIRLKHFHTGVYSFQHTMLQDCEKYEEEQLAAMAAGVLQGKSPDELILSLRHSLKVLISRYIYNWPDSRPFTDDMVSEGMCAIAQLCTVLTREMVEERGVLKVANQRCQDAIEEFLNNNQALASPGMTTQKTRIWDGDEPIYITACELPSESDDEDPCKKDDCMPVEPGDEQVRDILEAFSLLDPEDEIDEYLMDRLNWGRSNLEIARSLDTSRQRIEYRRERLYQRFLELTE